MRFFIICIQLFFTLSVTAQQAYETYSPANGLVDARVTNMVQDKYGRLIFLTREGFSIFDGQRFTNYLSVGNVQVGITDTYMFMPDSTLYLLRFSGGGIRIDKDRVTYDSSFLNGISEISDIKKTGEGQYLVISNKGMYRFSQNKLTPLVNKNTANNTSLDFIQNAAYSSGFLLLSHADVNKLYSVFLYDVAHEQVLSEAKTDLVSKVFGDRSGNLYVYFSSGIRQLDNEAMKQGRIVFTEPWFIKFMPPGFSAVDFYFDSKSNVWCVNRSEGILMISPGGTKRVLYPRAGGIETSATSIFQDAENNAWLICPGNGVQKMLQSRYEKINTLGGYDFSYTQLLYNIPGDGMFISSYSGTYIVKGDSVKPTGKNWISNGFPCFYWNGELWNFESHIAIRSLAGVRKNITVTDSATAPFQGSVKINTDRKGNLLVSGNYLYLLSKDGNAYAVQLPYFADKVAVDDDNNYWIFCRGGMVAEYRFENGSFKRLLSFKSSIEGARCAEHWGKNLFLVGTRSEGLLFVKVEAQGLSVVSRVTRENGISNNFILNLVKLDDKRIAVGTASGLDVITINGTDTSIQKLSLGINNYEPVYCMSMDDSGKVFSTSESTNNLFAYTANKFNSLQYRPHAYLSNVQVNGIQAGDRTEFGYSQNNFVFEVTASSFIDNNNINFYYSLESPNGDQKFSNSSGTLQVNNLEPGHYYLTIKVVYPGNVYPDEQLQYEFTIRKPFWKTWWFITVAIIILLGSIYLITRFYYNQQIRKKEAELEKQRLIAQERTRIATDMHDDFGANLSRIKFLSEKLQLNKPGDESLGKDLHKISIYSDEMAEKMNEIVWALNQRYDSLEDLVSFSRAWASEYLQDKNIKLNFFSDTIKDRKIQGEVRRNIFLIIKEALHNAVKHAGASAITIHFEDDEKLKVTIADNGKGINFSAIRPFANGLENMKKRMETIGGELLISNNNGTQIEITVGV